MDELRKNQAARKRAAKKAATPSRSAPPPRNPLPAPEPPGAGQEPPKNRENNQHTTSPKVSHKTSHDVSHATPSPASDQMVPAPVSTMPNLNVDMSAAEAAAISPTVMTIPASVKLRFDLARQTAATHTGMMLDAVRAHAHELPTLVLGLRPGPPGSDLFPYRPNPTGRKSTERREPLRVRPTVGELAVLDAIVEWVNAELRRLRPGTSKTNRSEVVGAALDAELPKKNRKKNT